MGTGFDGIFVLSTLQTEYDGFRAISGNLPQLGQIWTWQGTAVRMDGPQSTYLLDRAPGQEDIRVRASRAVRRRLDLPALEKDEDEVEVVLPEGFVISDGQERLTMLPVPLHPDRETLLICVDGVPRPNRPYTVIRTATPSDTVRRRSDPGGDVICFTSGTKIRTEEGDRLVEGLRPGDRVMTRDNGPQELVWVGSRHFNGAQLHAQPHLRPVRLRADALGMGRPGDDLLVSPHHRLLYEGKAARALFNSSEVLVAACDMLNDRTVFVDHALREVTYVHLMLKEHQILWANDLPSESFHPAQTSLETLEAWDRERLVQLCPEIEDDLFSYGPFARKNLSQPEAAILLHDLV